MKFPTLSLLLLMCCDSLYAMHPQYVQRANIRVYVDNQESFKSVANILAKFHLQYEHVADLNLKDDEALYIIAGKNIALEASTLPKYYILYQMEPYLAANTDLISKAIAVWDTNWAKSLSENSNKLKIVNSRGKLADGKK